MSPAHVFFFRGLSTYGHDHAKWSIFDFGPMAQHLVKKFATHNVILHPVTGMGSGPLSEIVNRAQLFLDTHEIWNDSAIPVHFLGHSTGGLVARKLVTTQNAKRRPLSCCTIASPHHGAVLAERCLAMPLSYPRSTRLLSAFRYDIPRRGQFFKELTPQAVETFFKNSPWPESVRAASIVCTLPRRSWCLPLRLIYKLKSFSDLTEISDGLVEATSQPFGEVLDQLPIDHFQQIGLFGAGPSFNHMCATVARFFNEISTVDIYKELRQ